MDIRINGRDAGIVLEDEKTVGDLLAGIESWLEGTGNRISALALDGTPVNSEEIPTAFDRGLDSLEMIDIGVSSRLDLLYEAFAAVRDALKAYADAPFEDRSALRHSFESDAAAAFLAEQSPDIAKTVEASLRGEGISPASAIKLVEERMRELSDPKEETLSCDALTAEIVSRLEDLPLDMQTGKDKRAMETIQLFSHITEKLFRLLSALKQCGFDTDTINVADEPFNRFINGFDSILQELLGAYEAQDTVLTGDIAEYEMAPRLAALYSAMQERVQSL